MDIYWLLYRCIHRYYALLQEDAIRVLIFTMSLISLKILLTQRRLHIIILIRRHFACEVR